MCKLSSGIFPRISLLQEKMFLFVFFLYPEPMTRILYFSIISSVVIVNIIRLLYMKCFLSFLYLSIIIWFPCCCNCRLTSLKFVWRYYYIVRQLIVLMYSKEYDNTIIWGKKSKNTQGQADKEDRLQ